MFKYALPALCLLATPLLLSSAPQTRVKPNEPADFSKLIANAKGAWDAEKYGACIKNLQEALGLATEKRVEKIRGALPAPIAGWEAIPEKKKTNTAAMPGLAALTMTVGSIVEKRYKETEGRGTVNVTVTADSPMVSMLGMVLGNPALLGEGKELIEYGTHKAILESRGNDSRNLQIIIDGKHICEVRTTVLSEDGLFAMFNQAAVDRLAAALSL